MNSNNDLYKTSENVFIKKYIFLNNDHFYLQQASSNCRTAKDELERMCRHLSDELKEFDYRKEQELKQVFIEYAESRFDVFEKVSNLY